MKRNIVLVIAFAVAATWPTPAFPATLPSEAPRLPAAELSEVATLSDALRQRATDHVQLLESSCQFGFVRDRLVEVRDEAVDAVRRIGGLWREGRLRHGGFALAEVLVHDLAGLVHEVIWSIAAAEALAVLQAQGRGTSGGDDLVARLSAIHPSAAACVATGPEPTPLEPVLVHR
jgi:hypothetical protein